MRCHRILLSAAIACAAKLLVAAPSGMDSMQLDRDQISPKAQLETPSIRNAATPMRSVQEICGDLVFAGVFEMQTHHCSPTGTTMVYTDRSEFLAALAVGHVNNNFDDIVAGASGELHLEDGGFQYRIVTIVPLFDPPGLLFNGDGFVSTLRSNDILSFFVPFFARQVNAVGADFWAVDFRVQPTTGTLDLFISDGTEETLESSGEPTFRGFISDIDIGTLGVATTGSDGQSIERWPAMDNLLFGLAR